MRVCVLNPAEPGTGPSGSRRVALETARALAAQGADSHVLTPSVGAPSQVRELEGAWHHRVHVAYPVSGPLVGLPVARPLHFAAAVWREVDRLHREQPVDIVVAPIYAGLGLLCGCDRRYTTVTRLFTPTALDMRLRPSMGAVPATHAKVAMERAAVLGAEHVQAGTRAIVQAVGEWAGAELPEPLIVALGVADRWAGAPPARPDAEVVVLFVGRLEGRKGVDVLLEAARRLVGEGQPVRFVLAGPDSLLPGSAERYREDFVAEAGAELASRVRFEGEVGDDRLWELYASCDIFCAPSRYESFGNVLIEAMMFGRPVVASAVGGIPEVVEDGDSGVLVAPGDADALAGALRELIADPPRRARLGEAARRRYEERFRLDAVAVATLEGYRALASGARRARTPTGAGDLRERVASVVGEVAGLDSGTARAAAGQLLEGGRDADGDFAAVAERVWMADADEFVGSLYRAAFAREPAVEELAGWADALAQGHSRIELMRALVTSAEAQALEVDVTAPERVGERVAGLVADRLRAVEHASDADFLRALYLAALGREPDEHGRRAWLHELASGRPRSQVVHEIAHSVEAQAVGAHRSEDEATRP